MAAVDGLDFDADEVREGLRIAIGVGLPVDPHDRPTFFFPQASSSVKVDWKDATAPTEPTKVQVACAVELFGRNGEQAGFGTVHPTRAVLTFLDEEYAQVEGFSYVVIGGIRFNYRRTQPPMGLVSVGVYIVHCQTDDEG